MKVHITTLGCKVNQFESQALETILRERGHELVDSGAADACVINTCAVTAESARKSRQAIRKARSENSNAIIAVCGCLSQINPDEDAVSGAELIYGTSDRRAFVFELERVYETGASVKKTESENRATFEKLPAGSLSGRTRAYLKVQDGCSNYCAYCVIPYARGPVRSLPVQDAVFESVRLYELGIKELIVTGIEISSYGRDLGESVTLPSLICEISKAAPEMRLRLGSLEPRVVTMEFVNALRGCKNLMPSFHLSLQSGCDDTLKRMNRRYSTARFFESVTHLRNAFGNCGISADLIAGFPGETDSEFAQTLSFIEKCSFSSMHIFPYSNRPGTTASKMTDQIQNNVKKQRAAQASNVADKMKALYLESCIGSKQSVLFEHNKTGVSTGHAGNNMPVMLETQIEPGNIGDVYITGVENAYLLGEICLESTIDCC